MLAFENNCFCFQVTSFFTKKVKFIQNVYKEGPLFDKKTYNWKTKAIVFKSLCILFFFFFFFLDIITLMLLAKFEFDTWFHLFKKKTKKQGNIKK